MEDVHLIPAHGPLHVHWNAVQRFDVHADASELNRPRVGEGRRAASRLGHRNLARTVLREDGHDRFVANHPRSHSEALPLDGDNVRLNLAADQRLARSKRGVDRDVFGRTADGIGGEKHAGSLGRDHLLDDDGKADDAVVDARASAVFDRPRCP